MSGGWLYFIALAGARPEGFRGTGGRCRNAAARSKYLSSNQHISLLVICMRAPYCAQD
jgi:hypothetical protein